MSYDGLGGSQELRADRREPPHWRCGAMAEQTSIETVKPIIAQCRRDIAAAWAHIEAAREVLRRSRPLQERWTEQIAAAAATAAVDPELAPGRLRSEGFVMIPALARRRRSRRRSASG